MKRDDVLRILAAHRDEFFAMGVRELAIFGSVARGEADARSDVDVLVDYEPGTRLSYFRAFELRERLEELLGAAQVDLVTMGGLRRELRDGILAEAIRAAWAMAISRRDGRLGVTLGRAAHSRQDEGWSLFTTLPLKGML